MSELSKARRRYVFRINPVSASASALLILSPFLTWITVVSVVLYNGVPIFGAAAQSDLFMVSSNQLGTNISGIAITSSIVSILLLFAAGFVMLKSARIAVPIGISGVAAYLVPMFSTFGSSAAGLEQTFISPGIGLFVATTGVILGSTSHLFESKSLSSLTQSLMTRKALSRLGASLGVIGLALDISNHSVLGQLSDFIGLNPPEQFLHLGLVAGIASIAAIAVLRSRFDEDRRLVLVSGATLALLGADAIFSTYTGNLQEFLGHNLTETVLHLLVYYGVALTTIAGLLGLRRN